jgi:hypothetical protein
MAIEEHDRIRRSFACLGLTTLGSGCHLLRVNSIDIVNAPLLAWDDWSIGVTDR